jgi:hypothetical protein
MPETRLEPIAIQHQHDVIITGSVTLDAHFKGKFFSVDGSLTLVGTTLQNGQVGHYTLYCLLPTTHYTLYCLLPTTHLLPLYTIHPPAACVLELQWRRWCRGDYRWGRCPLRELQLHGQQKCGKKKTGCSSYYLTGPSHMFHRAIRKNTVVGPCLCWGDLQRLRIACSPYQMTIARVKMTSVGASKERLTALPTELLFSRVPRARLGIQ